MHACMQVMQSCTLLLTIITVLINGGGTAALLQKLDLLEKKQDPPNKLPEEGGQLAAYQLARGSVDGVDGQGGTPSHAALEQRTPDAKRTNGAGGARLHGGDEEEEERVAMLHGAAGSASPRYTPAWPLAGALTPLPIHAPAATGSAGAAASEGGASGSEPGACSPRQHGAGLAAAAAAPPMGSSPSASVKGGMLMSAFARSMSGRVRNFDLASSLGAIDQALNKVCMHALMYAHAHVRRPALLDAPLSRERAAVTEQCMHACMGMGSCIVMMR